MSKSNRKGKDKDILEFTEPGMDTQWLDGSASPVHGQPPRLSEQIEQLRWRMTSLTGVGLSS